MNSDYRQPLDIANRALNQAGTRTITTMTEATDRAELVRSVYDKLRGAELRRAVWTFATRKVYLRPVQLTTMLVEFPAFDAAASYPKFFPVTASSGRIYQPTVAVAASDGPNDDTAGSTWVRFFGVDVAQPYSAETSWARGEIVYGPTGLVYLSLTDDSDIDPTAAPPAWDATISYRNGDTVTSAADVWQSDGDLNLNNTPGVSGWTLLSTLTTQAGNRVGQDWLYIEGATVSSLEIDYPLADGPAYRSGGYNVFRYPIGFIREAPQDTRAGSTSWLGAPWGLSYTDWRHENGYIVSSSYGPIVYRFVADVSDVKTFDPMFCETLGARIGYEIVERLTQATGKKSDIASTYQKFGIEARLINAIETGPVELPLDDYLAARV